MPFVFLTAKTKRADLRRGMELGADDALTKPFEETELLSAIHSRLARYCDLQAPSGLSQFLDDARAVGHLYGLTTDRKPRALRKKQELYAEGDEATRLYFVQSGQVKTVRRSPSGKELITGVYGAGEFLGYLPLLEQRPHAGSAVVLDDAVLLYISQEDFAQLLRRHPAVGQQVCAPAGRPRERVCWHSLRLAAPTRGHHAAAPARAGTRRGHSALAR